MSSEVSSSSEIDAENVAANGLVIRMLQSALSQGETTVRMVPRLIRKVLAGGMWRAYAFPEGGVYRWNAADFRQFLEAPRPAGCQTPISLIERLLRGTDAWEPYMEATRGEPGPPEGNRNAVGPRSGNLDLDECNSNRNIITDCFAPSDELDSPVTIPLAPDVPRPERKRDYARESKQGTSVSYAIRRLDRERPDLLEQVKTGAISPNAAMVKAGFRQPTITVPIDPAAAARRLARHFQGEALSQLIAGLMTLSLAESMSETQ